jgi:hypothetical protein
MAYIGNQVTSVPFTTDTFSGNGSQQAFTLSRAPAGTASIAVFIGSAYQPPVGYSLNGVTLTFASAPTAGTNNITVLFLGNGSISQVPSDGSVRINSLASDTYTYINAAFAQANTAGNEAVSIYANAAFAVANSGSSYANSAFLVANNGIGIDTTQNTNITSASSYANSGFAVANSSAGYANSGFAVANSAALYANSGFAAANTKAATSSPTFTGTVTIANSVTTVANVTNQLAVFGMAYQNIMTLTDATTITANLAQTNNFVVTLGGNRTLANATNITAGQSGFIVVRQDGTGSRTLSFGTGWRFPSATAPTLTTTASAVDLIVYTARDSGNLVAQAILSIT